MVFCVSLQVIKVNHGESGYQQLQFLLVEYGYQVLGDDLVEPLQKALQLGLDQLRHLHVAHELHVVLLVGLSDGDVVPVRFEVLLCGLTEL